MINKITRVDVIWAYLAQILKLGSGFLMLPIILYKLPQNELGLWYVFLALTGLILLIEVGFQPTISRLVTYVLSGQKEIHSDEIVTTRECDNNIDDKLLSNLCFASRSIYKFISMLMLLFFISIGTLYLNTFDEFQENQMIAWLIYISATVFEFYFGYYSGLIIGKGLQVRVYQSIAISKVAMLVVTIPLMLLDMGLIALSIGSFISALVSRLILSYYFKDIFKGVMNVKSNRNEINAIKISIWNNAKKLAFTSVGNFLIVKSGTFFISSSVGLEEAAKYGLSLQVVGIISSLCSLLFTISMPKINSWQIRNKKGEIRLLLKNIIVSVNFMYILGAATLIAISIYVVPNLNINTQLLDLKLLCILLIIQYLDLNHSICATYLTSLNIVPFAKSAVLSGVAIFVISFFSTPEFGVLGILLTRGCVQLAYNNWKWPLTMYKSIKV